MKAKLTCLLQLVVALVLIACTPRQQATPIVKSPTGIYYPGKFVWYDLLTDDLESAERFYYGLFGWKFNTAHGYTEILNNDVPIGGIVVTDSLFSRAKPARWLPSLSVADVHEAVAETKQLNGQVIDGPGELTGRGDYALIEDASGARLILLHSSNGDPLDQPVAIGAWLWNELWTDQRENALHFYKQLAGYQEKVLASAYTILILDDKWRAGMRQVFIKDLEPLWVPTIRVYSTALTASLAEQLGGEVLVRMDPVNKKRDVALIRDPNDALFMVQSWSDQTENKEK